MRRLIRLNDVPLKTQVKKQQILKIISQVLDSGVFFYGPQTKKLESSLAKMLDSGYICSAASGHDALLLSLSSLNLNKDDEIVFPVNSLPTAFPICMSAGKPVPVDVDKNGQLDPKMLEKSITRKTRAVVIVHLYGIVGELDRILDIVKGRNITVIEDCAQALGSKYKGKLLGTFGDISCFSFYPTKNVGTLGDGGIIRTKNKKLHQFFLKASSYGETKRYFSTFISGHSRIPEIQAAIVNLYLENFDQVIKEKRVIEKMYQDAFAQYGLLPFLRVLKSSHKSSATRSLFVAETHRRDKLKSFLKRCGIETDIHYPYPIHLLPAFSHLGLTRGSFPIAERLSKNIISLPFHSFLSKDDVFYIAQSLKDFYHD